MSEPLTETLRGLVRLVEEHQSGRYVGGDWACVECHPESDLLSPGWKCALHRARALLSPDPERKIAHVIEVYGPNYMAWELFGAVMESLADTMDDGPMVTNEQGVDFLAALASRGYRVVPDDR